MKKKQPSYQPNPRFQKRLLAEKEAKLDLLEQHLSQIDQSILDAQDRLEQEQQHQDAEYLRLNDELTLLLATPPATDGRDDARRIRQASKRPLTEKEVQLQAKKRLSPGIFLDTMPRVVYR